MMGTAAAGVLDSPLPKGEATPPLALASLHHGLSDLAAERGKVVLVHFFATWCEPCRDEMAGLSRLSVRMAGKPFAILAVDVGEVEIRVRRFFAEQPVPFPVLLDPDRSAKKAWKVEVFPTTFVLDPNLNLQLFAAGEVDWDDPATGRILDRLAKGEPLDAQKKLPTATDLTGSKQ